MPGVMKGLLFFSDLELANNLRRILADHVKGRAEPAIDAVIQQPVGKEEQKAHGKQRKRKKGNHHSRLEPGAQLLLFSLDVEFQQNTCQDQSKNHKGDKYESRKSQ